MFLEVRGNSLDYAPRPATVVGCGAFGWREYIFFISAPASYGEQTHNS
ncbi:hypothetical protein BIFGAL_04290 [Bifidobacterium gallicum DSM 20093 = LMG 11596]|uniref:Uncharacterized protein n=1 Tax=Bifidobacterium gallicum DSM 20093 = LMG 11596 TaxID=561180 RepID=D1NWN6_9BIFI|nr:hypothetical protein BIFGAL_04290 [Bifidobacterium gallicum DSM 20093 = LMG 11596]